VLIAVTVAPTTSAPDGSVTIPDMLPVMLAHTSAELSKDPSATAAARRMIRRFRIVVPPVPSWSSPKNFLENGLRSPDVLLDFDFIKFIEIGFTFSIGFLSSRIIGTKA
jgi:hypothetical protein